MNLRFEFSRREKIDETKNKIANARKETKMSCKICQGTHDTTDCPELDFDDLIEIRNIVRRAKERKEERSLRESQIKNSKPENQNPFSPLDIFVYRE